MSNATATVSFPVTAPAKGKTVDKHVPAVAGKTVNITNNAEARAALARLKELKAAESAGAAAKREREKTVEPLLRALLGDASEFIVRGVVAAKVSSPRSNTHYDAELLAKAFPEAEVACRVTTNYNFITVS